MRVILNGVPHDIPEGSTLADALALLALQGPFAAAVNLQFVPRSRYADTPLKEGDAVEAIAPVTGG